MKTFESKTGKLGVHTTFLGAGNHLVFSIPVFASAEGVEVGKAYLDIQQVRELRDEVDEALRRMLEVKAEREKRG